jgi:beta-glucosidase
VRRGRAALLVASAALLSLAVPAASAAAPGPCGDPGQRPWCDTALPADQRAGLLLGALTQDEKLSLLAGVESSDHTGQTAAIDRVGLRSVYLTDDAVGVKQGKATALPIPMSLAATFDSRMATLAGTVVGDEAKAKGNDILLGPTVNLMRTPLGGRTFEAYGEDPFLISRTAVSWIKALQSQGVIAEVKHYCCNNQEGQAYTVGQKNYSSSDLDERTLREIYLPQFEAAVREAHAGTVMCAYNRVNDDWACENRHLLTDILKGEWGFPGAVVSDWQATHETVLALRNGLDLEMPTAMDYSPMLVSGALASGLVTQADVDDHVRRLLRTLFSFGFFDRAPYANDDRAIDQQAHATAARQIEESGITLLKNDHVLPLDPGKLKSIALIGPQADRFENGGGADNVDPFLSNTPRQEIAKRAGPHVSVAYDDGSDAARAAGVAKAADLAIVFASDSEGEYMEKACASVDCTTFGRTGNQDDLISTVAAANPNTVVVLETGDPVLTPWRGQVKGLLEAWYPGEEGGAALARVLFGDVDPGGRLPATFPNSEADLPTAGDPTKYPGGSDVYYKEGVLVGYRWYDANGLTPAYPFGAGLSYTTFRFSDLRTRPTSVSVRVTNTGDRTGAAVPQLYLGLPSPSPDVVQPPRQLKGFTKLSLPPGRSETMSFPLDERAFSYWDVGTGGWRVAPGCYGVFVGSSSRDLPLQGAISRGGASCPTSPDVTSRRCGGRRVFAIHLARLPHGVRTVRATVTVAGRRVKARRIGRRYVARIDLRGLARHTVRVRIRVRGSDGRVRRSTRTYHPCRRRA